MSTQVADYTDIMGTVQEYMVYNPSPIELQAEVAGNTIRFCPQTEDRGYGPGVTIVGPIPFGIRRPDLKNNRPGEDMEARLVVRHILGDDGRSGQMGSAGLRALTADVERNARIISEADQAWAEKRYMNAKARIRNHEKAVVKAKEAQVDPPVPDKSLREDYKFVRDHESSYGGIATHPCRKCNAPANSEQERQEHMRDIHGETVEDVNFGPVTKQEKEDDLRATIAELARKIDRMESRKKPGPKPGSRRKAAEGEANG